MVLLYTGASEYNREQPNHLLSRGGFISSTIAGNRFFDEVSLNILNNRKEEFFGVVLKNTTNTTVSNVTISWTYTSADRMCDLNYAAVGLVGEKAEQLIDPFSSPNVIGSWAEALTPQLIKSSLPVNDMILIWFKRFVKSSFKIPKDLTDVELATYYETVSALQSEGFDLKIEYT